MKRGTFKKPTIDEVRQKQAAKRAKLASKPIKPKKAPKPKAKKKKKPTVTSLKKKLWKVFTTYIKKRDGNRCITCGASTQGHNAQGGHYIAKGACGLEWYFHERNVHCQCIRCNLTLEGNRPAYRNYILAKYGRDFLEELETNYHRPYDGDSHEWLLAKIEHYKNL